MSENLQLDRALPRAQANETPVRLDSLGGITIQEIDWRDVNGFGPSTHLQPISTLGEYLTAELDCQVYLLGIQPGRLELDEALTPEVQRSIAELVKFLKQLHPMNR